MKSVALQIFKLVAVRLSPSASNPLITVTICDFFFLYLSLLLLFLFNSVPALIVPLTGFFSHFLLHSAIPILFEKQKPKQVR